MEGGGWKPRIHLWPIILTYIVYELICVNYLDNIVSYRLQRSLHSITHGRMISINFCNNKQFINIFYLTVSKFYIL